MHRLPNRIRSWLALAGLVGCVFVLPAQGTDAIEDPSAFLDHAESLRTKDHPQFVQLLAKIHGDKPTMDQATRWHLRYLDTWEAQFQGDYKTAELQLQDIIAHADDPGLAIKASSLLLNNYAASRRFEKGFALANQLAGRLPGITDPQQRYWLLMNLSTTLDLAGEIDLAVHYADLMERSRPPGESPCYPLYLRVAALVDGKRLTSSSPEVQQAIDACMTGRQTVIANATWLVLGDLYLNEGQPSKALAVLDKIAPAINIAHYYPHMVSEESQRARAYEQLGRLDDARKAALSAVALGTPDETSEWLAASYGVLYRVAKKLGDTNAALSYYEQYVTQDKGNLSEISARTMAYALSQQHLMVQKLETESLGRQNNILRLKQALDAKAAETSHLYILLLLLAIASVAFWAYRTKRSQLRFRKLANHDGLTGIYHHQHFMAEAERCLRALQKRSAPACLVSIDLDHFKQVNDTHGHAVGDAVLRHVVTLCRQQLRPNDLFGRLGGEEFGMLLIDCSSAEGLFAADRIRMAIEASPLMEDGRVVALSASIGLSCTGQSGYTLQTLCRDSDAALYRAKRSGRNRVVAHISHEDHAIDGMPDSNLSNVTG